MNRKALPESKNFLGLEEEFSSLERSGIVIQQVPYEHTSSYLSGSDKGPQEIVAASHFVEFFNEEFADECCYDIGICTLEPLEFSSEEVDGKAIEKIQRATTELLDMDKFVVTLGAEHTITFGTVKAFDEKFKDLSVLQLDAHSDLRDAYQDNKYSHASVMARVNELGLKIGQVAIRAQCKEEYDLIESSQNIHTVYDHQMVGNEWMDGVISHLTDEVYVTIDTDGLDPAITPAVGTAEPGGLGWRQTLILLERLAKSGKKVVGFDIVELAPIEGDIRTQFTMAKLLYKFISLLNKYQKL